MSRNGITRYARNGLDFRGPRSGAHRKIVPGSTLSLVTALNPRRRTRAIVLAATTAVAAAAALAISVPATAATGSTVSGTITYGTPGAAATPHSSVRLYALNADGRPSGGSYTASSTPADLGHATFTVGNVAPGRYRVYVGATDNDGGANAATWFGDTPFEDDASVVTVGAGSVTGVDVTQPVAGSISATSLVSRMRGSASFASLR